MNLSISLEKTTSTENDLGEYFTPRNIVKTIINLVDPKFKETIYDPFCGTGGFLTEAFNYIKENNIINTDEDLEKLRFNTYYNGIAKNNGDAACVLHCLQNLKEGGRMALVVPEGFLFRKTTAAVRQFLLSKTKLQLVISLPQSTFIRE